jgi:hypothetical protein
MERYKSLKITDFSRGEQQFSVAQEAMPITLRATKSLNYNLQERGIDIPSGLTKETMAGETMGCPINSILVDTDMFSFVLDGSNGKVYKSANGAAYSLIKTIANVSETKAMIYSHGKITLFYTDNVGGKIAYSIDNGANWTTITDSQNIYPIVTETLNEITYVLTDMGVLYTSIDGYTFILLYDSSANDYMWRDLEIFQGELYCLKHSPKKGKAILGKIENGKFNERRNFKCNGLDASIKAIGNSFLLIGAVLNQQCTIFVDDGDTSQQISLLKDKAYSQAFFFYSNEENAFLYLTYRESSTDKAVIIQITNLKGIFKQRIFEVGSWAEQGFELNDQFYICGQSISDHTYARWSFSWADYAATAEFYIDQIQVGPHIPVGIVAYFRNGISKNSDGTQTTQNIEISTFCDNFSDVGLGIMDVAQCNFDKAKAIFNDDDHAMDGGTYYRRAYFPFIKTDLDREGSDVSFYIKLSSNSDNADVPLLKAMEYIYLPTGIENAK